VVVTFVAAAPLAYVSLIFGSGGINDRNNLVPSVGIAFIVAAALHQIWNRNRGFGNALAILVVALFAVLNVADTNDYVEAVRAGEIVTQRVLEDIAPNAGLVLVGPPLDGGRGMEQFILQEDLRASLLLRYGSQWRQVWMYKDAASCRELTDRFGDEAETVSFYDWRSRSTVDFEDRHCNTG
jgi:predicted Rdx family selenoprotein